MSSGQIGTFILENFGWIAAVSVILILICGILLLSLNVSRSLGRNGQRSADSDDVQALEGTLKRLIESTQTAASSTAPARASSDAEDTDDEESVPASREKPASKAGAASGGARADLERELKKRDAEIRKLREELKNSSENTLDEDALTMAEERIKELESRLAEYEIIEDDIADLSLFKEENARLRAELESMRAAQGLPPLDDSPASAELEEETTSEPVMTASVTDLPEEPILDVSAVSAGTSEDTGSLDEMEQDIMAEFAAAVQQQKGPEGEADSAESDEEAEADADADALNEEEGGLNADALMAEAAELAELNDSAAAVEEPVLDVGLDTDKLAAEAEELPGEKRTGSD